MTTNIEVKPKPYSREEYLEITRRQKPPEGYVPYSETRNAQWIESFCYCLRRIFRARDFRRVKNCS